MVFAEHATCKRHRQLAPRLLHDPPGKQRQAAEGAPRLVDADLDGIERKEVMRGQAGMVHHKTALMALALAGCTEAAAPAEVTSREDSVVTGRFQQRLDALHAAGIVGVLGEVSNG